MIRKRERHKTEFMLIHAIENTIIYFAFFISHVSGLGPGLKRGDDIKQGNGFNNQFNSF